MNRGEILRRLRAHRDELQQRFGVKSLALFGSVARGEAGPDSDIDILVEFDPEAHIGLFKMVELKEFLERVLGRPVDIVTPDGLRAWMRDIIEAIQDVVEYTKDMDFESFAKDRRTLQAVVYCFIVIGEAERHIPQEIKDKHPEIPWDKMRGMRNFLVHEYPWISPRIIWETAVRDLPPLLEPLCRILEASEP